MTHIEACGIVILPVSIARPNVHRPKGDPQDGTDQVRVT